MAIGGTPVGNMVIKVDLDSAGVEKSMTGLQRQLKSSNKAMGAQLSAFDRGEKSTQKYGVMIEGLSNRHRIQARMVEEARGKYDSMSATYGENSVKAQQASQELNEQIARYQETGRELDNVTAEFQEFQRVQDIQNTGWYKAADSMEQWGGKLKTAGATMDQTGRTMTRGVTLPLAAIGGMAVKVGSDFEAGMSKVGAISGASTEDMGKMEEQARELGATTVFSASEAASGMEFLAMAGFETNEIMSAMPGLLDLAASSNMDLGRAADIASNIISGFGMEAEEAGRVSDVLAKGASSANTDVEGLGDSMATVAPVAATVGLELEDMAAATGKMADSGIQGSKAGRMLRQGILRLSKPTGEAADLIDELGINVFDADGNMKDMDKVVAELEKGLDGMSSQAQAAALSTIFGSESTAGWSALLETGSETLGDYSDELKNSEGAAKDMADTMQDNLQGSLKELKSMLEDLFIEMYQNLKPALESVIDGAKGLTQWFANLSPETQENIVKFGALAAAMGPVLSITGKMTMGIGGLMQGAGALTKTIGLSKGVGLLGALSALGPVAIGGIAVAGIVGVATAVKGLKDDSEELEAVNLDVAESLTDQAVKLEASAETFDKLSDKAKISNEQLAELNDLNIRISESSNPGEINELQQQYDRLAEKSGLSKDELEELFGANKNIIEQSPDVEKSISDQGNEFVESTDAVNEYVQSLYEMSRQELSDEMIIAEENKREILKDNKKLNEEIAELNEKSKDLRELEAMSEEERNQALLDWHTEIQQGLADKSNSQEEYNELKKEEEIVQGYINDGIGQGLEEIRAQRDALNEKIEKNDEELEKIEALDQEMANIVLKQAGITEEGEKGLQTLDEKLAKNKEDLAELDQQLEKNGKLTEKEQEKYEKLVESNGKLQEAKQYLNDELGIYQDINSLANGRLESLDQEGQKRIDNLAKSIDLKNTEQDIVAQIDKKNGKLLEERDTLEENRQKQGANKKEIDKQISSIDEKIGKNAQVKKQVLEELGVWDDLDDKIKDGINSEIRKGGAVDDTKSKVDNQGSAIDNNNRKTDIGIGKEQERSAEAGRNVDKRVNVSDYGTVLDLTRRATKIEDKTVNVKGAGFAELNRKASSPVTKTVNIVAKAKDTIKNWFAKGTPPGGHKGGPAVVGDGGGRELVQLPSGHAFLSPDTDTALDLPRGTHVIPHRETERILRNMPKYASGTSNWSDLFSYENLRNNEFMKLLALTNRDDETKVTLTPQPSNDADEMKEMVKVMKEFLQVASQSTEVNQTNHYHNTGALSPSESARKNKQMLRRLAMEWR